MSNFTSVPYPFIEIVKPAIEAENFVYDNTEVAGLFLRKGLEAWVHFIYQNEPELTLPYDTTISSLIKEPTFIEIVNNTGVLQQMNAIRLLGNKAVHNSGNKVKISTQEIIHHLHLLHGISYYFINLYGEEYIKPPQFSDENIPLAQKIQQNILNQEILKLKEQLTQKAELEKENAQLQAQMLANRLATQSTVLPPKDPNEALTRTYLIDNLLQEAGWDLSLPNVKEFRIEGMPNNKEEGFADYVLWGKNGKPLAVVEAKRTSRDPQVGRHQAELYAKNLENKYGQKPNIFLTNGYEIHFYDWNYPIRQLQGFYTQDELELNIQRRNSKIPLHQIDVNANITDRYYQIEAIKAVANRIEAHFIRTNINKSRIYTWKYVVDSC
jgi:type I restriction enzyme R subunit